MSLTAYHKAQVTFENPRNTEVRLFGQVTHALMDADADPGPQKRRLIEALDWNRRVWSALATDCAHDGNRLPESVRAQIISLSLWVTRHSGMVVRGEAKLDALIDVNRTLMQGLQGQPG